MALTVRVIIEFLRLKCVEIGRALWKAGGYVAAIVCGVAGAWVVGWILFGAVAWVNVGWAAHIIVAFDGEPWMAPMGVVCFLLLGLIMVAVVVGMSCEFVGWVRSNWQQAKCNVAQGGAQGERR